MTEYEIGDTMTFIPSAFVADCAGMKLDSLRPEMDLRVTGTVDYVNAEHHYVRVAYETAYGLQHECFKY